jgi:hypothetical protein
MLNPYLIIDNRSDIPSGHSEGNGQSNLRLAFASPFSNLPHLLPRKASLAVAFAVSMATFGVAVMHIVERRAEKKMVRVYAKGCITFMQNVQSSDWPFHCSIGKRMGGFVPATNCNPVFATFVICKASISAKRPASPKPATVSLENKLPKPVFRLAGVRNEAQTTTICSPIASAFLLSRPAELSAALRIGASQIHHVNPPFKSACILA